MKPFTLGVMLVLATTIAGVAPDFTVTVPIGVPEVVEATWTVTTTVPSAP